MSKQFPVKPFVITLSVVGVVFVFLAVGLPLAMSHF